jgi:Cd(II)/Pb(II)-responsive transcriptional regulator
MRIGELSKRTGTAVDTLRYYEKSGLMQPPPRRANGYRDYAEDAVERVAFIRHCRALGMSLDAIERLLHFSARPQADCAAIDRLVEEQLAQVNERIAGLQALARQLEALRTTCRVPASAGECGILRELTAAARDERCACHPGGLGDPEHARNQRADDAFEHAPER